MPVWVACLVVQDNVTERHVPDHQIGVAAAQLGVSERFGADISRRVQGPRDRRRRRIKFDTSHLRGGRGRPDERSGPTPRLQHATAREPQHLDCLPYRGSDGRVGVVRVEGRPLRGTELLMRESRFQRGPFSRVPVTAVIKDLRHRAPPRPPRKN